MSTYNFVGKMHLALFVAITASLASVAKGQDYVEECPEENGFFADAVQCDRYYECKNGQVGLTGVNILPFSRIFIGEKFFTG